MGWKDAADDDNDDVDDDVLLQRMQETLDAAKTGCEEAVAIIRTFLLRPVISGVINVLALVDNPPFSAEINEKRAQDIKLLLPLFKEYIDFETRVRLHPETVRVALPELYVATSDMPGECTAVFASDKYRFFTCDDDE